MNESPIAPGEIKKVVEKARSLPPHCVVSDTSDAIIFRKSCKYCILASPIQGVLTLTCESLVFEPDERDASVDECGYGSFQVHIPVGSILECGCIGGPHGEWRDDPQDEMRCNGFLQVMVSCNNQQEQVKDENPYIQYGISKLISMVAGGVFSSTRPVSPPPPPNPTPTFVLFGFFSQETAHDCTVLLMDAMDASKNRKTPGCVSVPFTSNSLIAKWTELRNESSGASCVPPHVDFVNTGLLDHVVSKSSIFKPWMIEKLLEHLPAPFHLEENSTEPQIPLSLDSLQMK
ncbi:hypothetical protein BdWA1_003197 [Babesia duncani]|uniref:Uncharacterized protein n=1 Tax=Babesia duncani TaxID=323732 RepID=A0AAD9UN80_9APIC|nr:hypothetical protein BdWA1_003197 [Babesia duncani]